MIRGIYTAAAGMVSSVTRLMRLTNNMANIATPGYKQDLSPTDTFDALLLARIDAQTGAPVTIGPLTTYLVADRAELDLGQGNLRQTGRDLDLAVSGEGFFVVQRDGDTYYTRNGSFLVGANGQLQTEDGGSVLGEGGPLTLGPGMIGVSADGAVAVDGVSAGRLSVVTFPQGMALRKVGDSYFQAEGATPVAVARPQVAQGFLEESNVDAARSMLDLLATQRSFSASQRLLQLQDAALQKAVNEIGRL